MHKLLLTLVTCQAVWLLDFHDLWAQDSRVPATPPQITWIEDPKLAVVEAQRQRRPMLLYVTADYCGYCRKMERDSWSNAGVANRVNQHFVSLKLDAEKYGQLGARLGVRGYPATIVLDAEGQHVQTIEGFVGPQKLLKALENRSTQQNPRR